MTRNIVQSQNFLSKYNNVYRKSLQNEKTLINDGQKKEILNGLPSNKDIINNRSSIYDEQ